MPRKHSGRPINASTCQRRAPKLGLARQQSAANDLVHLPNNVVDNIYCRGRTSWINPADSPAMTAAISNPLIARASTYRGPTSWSCCNRSRSRPAQVPENLLRSTRMGVRDLKVFAAVAETGVVTRAAVPLNTVQSNVTARLHALEEELGVARFHRHGRCMSLTSAGIHLQAYAARILALVDEAKSAVAGTGEPRDVFRLGSMETTAAIPCRRFWFVMPSNVLLWT
jgi:Bacterial regulatory helix-turn-helix protein, lysR family